MNIHTIELWLEKSRERLLRRNSSSDCQVFKVARKESICGMIVSRIFAYWQESLKPR